jgi:hypothetical protein
MNTLLIISLLLLIWPIWPFNQTTQLYTKGECVECQEKSGKNPHIAGGKNSENLSAEGETSPAAMLRGGY